MNTLANPTRKLTNLFWQVHEKISSWTAHLIGPLVFNFGIKEEPWKMSTADFLKFPEETVGRALGEFLKGNRLEIIAGTESHDVYHILFDFSSSFKDEVGLQFFLRGNGKYSIASFGTSIGAWIVLPTQWSYLRTSYRRGKQCKDVSTLNLKEILDQNLHDLKKSLFN